MAKQGEGAAAPFSKIFPEMPGTGRAHAFTCPDIVRDPFDATAVNFNPALPFSGPFLCPLT